MGFERKFEIIKLLCDLGANPAKAGAVGGPDALLEYDSERNRFFSGHPVHTIIQKKRRDDYEAVIGNARYIDAIWTHLNEAAECVFEVAKFGGFPFVMSGDHSNGAATIAGLRSAHPEKRLGVIWVDAHADIHTPYTTPSGNMHGMPVAAALFEDNRENARHELEGVGLQNWEAIKNLGMQGQANIQPEDILFIEVRDTETEEDNIILRRNIRVIGPGFREIHGVERVAEEALKFAASFDLVYVSFDIDSMDAALVPGTGTPVTGGMSPNEAGILLSHLWPLENLVGFEITEMNPQIEKELTLSSVYQALTGMFLGTQKSL